MKSTSPDSEAIGLLQQLIRIPSFSREESDVADLLVRFFAGKGISAERSGNNIIVRNAGFDASKPSILLNSHIDTVKPNKSWHRDPFDPKLEHGKLYGLGSNDAGGSLVSLVTAFLHYYDSRDLAYNIILAATAEEEISGSGGIESITDALGNIELAIVGEPTQLKLAVAEKGLMVLDCIVRGVSGHAARDEGENAIYRALKDIDWFRSFRFPMTSDLLGPVKMSVTIIHSGTQHNVVPDLCAFTVDIRSTDAYTNRELLSIIREHVHAEVTPRSTRLNPSGIPSDHRILGIAESMGITTFGSPTLSDQALMPFPSVKIGPGESARSHTSDEFIFVSEIEEGVSLYIDLLDRLLHA
jgi:acetylornithine deacetylase